MIALSPRNFITEGLAENFKSNIGDFFRLFLIILAEKIKIMFSL